MVITGSQGMRFGCFGENKSILKCLRCDLVQLFPQWSSEALEKIYKNYGRKIDFKGHKPKARISKYLLKLISQEDRILEVGCGNADMVGYLSEKGYDVTGIDKDDSGIDSNTDLNIVIGDVLKYFPKEKFDVVYGIHFLEHVPNPKEFMWWVVNAVKKYGKFIFEIPCVEDPLIRVYKIKAFENFYWYPYHLFFYSKKTAENLFCGLKVTVKRKQTYGIVNHLRWIFLRRPGNFNPHIPIIDDIYKFLLVKMGVSDTLLIAGKNV